MSLFISEVLASINRDEQEKSYSVVIMLLIFGLIFYFVIFRPQQKRAKEHKKLVDSISKGDEVLTSSGLIGRVTKISKIGYVIIALNENNVVIIKSDCVASILPKGTIDSIGFF